VLVVGAYPHAALQQRLFPGADYAGAPRLFGDLLGDTGTAVLERCRVSHIVPTLAAGTRDRTFSIQLTPLVHFALYWVQRVGAFLD
jgi:hypothetical protein